LWGFFVKEERRRKREEGRGKMAPRIKKRVLQKSSRGFAQILQWI
jgi:hypothetical protein